MKTTFKNMNKTGMCKICPIEDCKSHYNTTFPKSAHERSISACMLITGIASFQPLFLKQYTPTVPTLTTI